MESLQVAAALGRAGDGQDRGAVFLVTDAFGSWRAASAILEDGGLDVVRLGCQDALVGADRLGRLAGCVLIGAPIGPALQHHLRQANDRLKAILVSERADIPMAVRAVKAGAFDVLCTPVDPGLLVSSIRQALKTLRAPDGCKSAMMRAISPGAATTALASLTDRQNQILDGILQGQPNKNIAADLGISQRTVENHRAAIMKKMGASSISSLVQVAMSAGGLVAAG